MDLKHASSKVARIAHMQAEAEKRKNEGVTPVTDTAPAPLEIQSPEPVVPMCTQPVADQQDNFFVASLYDIGPRDSRRIMDVAAFRLSKKDLRPNSRITYELPDAYITVTSGPHGMASVWDYDIVLMAVSHLTEAMNRFREGKGEKPGPRFRTRIGALLKFCRRDNGGKQKDSVVGSLERLGSTFITIESKKQINNKPVTINEGENHIAKFLVTTSGLTGKVEFIEIIVSDWVYRQVTDAKASDVLTVHPDYFLIDSGIGRFLYRLARRAAGQASATWGFRTLYERSGSASMFFEFSRMLRALIRANALPEYELMETSGKSGPMLTMTHRSIAERERLH